MLVIPEINLMEGKPVILEKGSVLNSNNYGYEPVELAEMFSDMGAKRIHIVDIDGARSGENKNLKVVEQIMSSIDTEIELGGGIRDMKRLEVIFGMGIKYAVLGTAIVDDEKFTKEALEKYPNKIILSLDVRDWKIATRGWDTTSAMSPSEVLSRYKGYPVEGVIINDIEKDGTMCGLNMVDITQMLRISDFPVVASGGVASISDIQWLKSLENPKIKGCIVGRAFYEGKMDLDRAFSL